jgi:hypothetical protein
MGVIRQMYHGVLGEKMDLATSNNNKQLATNTAPNVYPLKEEANNHGTIA